MQLKMFMMINAAADDGDDDYDNDYDDGNDIYGHNKE